ncbi:hypothetical protein CAOG_007019 [Capsaspora owczarzaki ATCC 30864]|uniref:Peroxisomal biogenesis factor 11 n=1 Tax=Capsaspora owczarzaki (strain ATCC 30864) TaxID=595528 RepID=A0A0D2WVA2_CAPO3|nr:hypothetical protein CAOG_007019 [Capsaspora owczarzaki ATCC 30864]
MLTVQYASKLIGWYLARTSASKGTIEKFSKLESNLSLARKLFRVGKPIDFFVEILRQVKNADPVLRNTLTGRAACLSGWLLIDHLLWFAKAGIVNVDAKKWSRRSAWFWLAGLILAVVRDIYQYMRVEQARARYIQRSLNQPNSAEQAQTVLSSPTVQQFDKDLATHRLELIKDVCDLIIPSSSLELIQPSAGLVGLLGLISSLIGLHQVWPKQVPK